MNTNEIMKPKTYDNSECFTSFYESTMYNQHIQQDPFSLDLPLEENVPTKYETIKLKSTTTTKIDSINKESLKSFESFIIETIHQDDTLSLSSKLYFTRILLLNFMQLRKLSDDFYEEECHLSLLNWIWNVKHILISWDNSKDKNSISNDKAYDDENILSIILELLNNILIILETLPIKSNDILDLKLYEKLNKIKGYVYKLPPFPFCNCVTNNINFVLGKWKNEIDMIYNIKEQNKKKKYSEEDEETKSTSIITDADSDDVSCCFSFGFGSEGVVVKKNKKVSFNLLKNKAIEFDKEDEPFKVTYKKNEYDPLVFF